MRSKFLALASATRLGLPALIGFQSAARAHEGYRYRSLHVEHRDRNHHRGYSFHIRHDQDRR